MKRIWTVGHSNRNAETFLALLTAAKIQLVVDVRRYPGSRKWPHFRRDALRALLHEHAIGYEHIADLGGRRGTPSDNSPNTGWRIASFAAYADYMATGEFRRGLTRLELVARERRAAMMCSEAVPWRCHRRLIADALIVRGWEVLDILSAERIEPHAMTAFARLSGGEITYPD